MKKLIAVLVLTVLIFNLSYVSHADNPSITADSAILIDAKTGKVLYEKNAHKIMYPASTTKIMTAILALERGNLDDKITIDNDTPLGIDGSHIALEPGEIISLKDLLHALLIESANDSAVAIAKHISGSVDEFAKLMNKKAKDIGALNTHFTNPNGLPDPKHVTTAYDLAMMAKYAMENETFKEIVSSYKYTIEPTNKKSEPRYLKSANRMLYGVGPGHRINVNGKVVDIKYPGADGIKTGYTDAAQQCLVASATRGNQRLISVVLKAIGTNIYVDTHNLLNYGFENFSYKQVGFKNEFITNIEVEHGDKQIVPAILGEQVSVIIPKGRETDLKKNIVLPEKISAPVSMNQVLGKVEYILDGEVLATANIISTTEVYQKGIYKVVDTTTNNSIFKKWWFWLLLIFIVFRINVAYKRHKRKKLKRKRYSFSYNTNNYIK